MAIGIILLTLFYTVCGNVEWIQSPRITPWGNSGPEELCPMNSFITGMRLKMDHIHSGDNTALNAVELICTSVYGENSKNITSATGRFGYYGKFNYCPGGFATGFQLRSQNGQGNARDDVAAVDFKLICTDIHGISSYVIDDDNEMLPWGYWTQDQHCPSNMAVCGIATQVEDMGFNPNNEDETTLNNVDIACCPLTVPIETCQLNYNWETMIGCHSKSAICEVTLPTGFTETEQLSKFRKFYHKLGYVSEFNTFMIESLKGKANIYAEKINNKSLENIIGLTKVTKPTSFKVKCHGIIQQLVFTCDIIKLYSYESRCVPDQYAEKEWESDSLYFQPMTHFETIFWSYNCDFTGNNVANQTSEISDCGDICLTNIYCTHFVWNKYNGGTCWLKGSETISTPVERYNDNFLCGWVERPSLN